jgi:hypothetical protein
VALPLANEAPTFASVEISASLSTVSSASLLGAVPGTKVGQNPKGKNYEAPAVLASKLIKAILKRGGKNHSRGFTVLAVSDAP